MVEACMKRITLISRSLFLLVQMMASGIVFADTALDQTETLAILKHLTSRPRRTWIPTGTIEAVHEEYRAAKVIDPEQIKQQIKEQIEAYQSRQDKPERTDDLQKMQLDATPFNVRYRLSNEYAMKSTVLVRYDGERFYWEIKVNSRTDSVPVDANLAGNFMTNQFDMDWNARRIFAYNGQMYTKYFLPGNQAIMDSTGRTPRVVNGPLTAGLIPWGYGFYSYENLAASEPTGVEKYIDGRREIHLEVTTPTGMKMSFALDPQKNYAMLSYSISYPEGSVTAQQYSDHQLVLDNWVPTTIVVDRYEAMSNRLLARDHWHFTSISGECPLPDSFEVELENDAIVEYGSHLTDKPVMYQYSVSADTASLLYEKLAFEASQGTVAQNCATAALKYVTMKLGKQVTDQTLAQLVGEPNGETNLFAMKQFVNDLGLHWRAVKTDLQTLRGLRGCQVILHIPGKQHFAVLERIDDSDVWLIDLASNKFYYRISTDFFGMDWPDGTALIVSAKPILLQPQTQELSEDALLGIIGGAGYSCTRLLQNWYIVFCEWLASSCYGYYEEHYERWGCQAAPSGSCTSRSLIRYIESPCVLDLYDPLNCYITEIWTTYYMRACE